MASLTEVKRALSKSLGFTVAAVRYGIRCDLDNPRAPHVIDVREWAKNSDLWDNPDLTTDMLREWAQRPEGIIVDLYVYSMLDRNPEHLELETNATLVIAHGGELLAAVEDRWPRHPVEAWFVGEA